MRMLLLAALALSAAPVFAVKPCANATTYSPCDIVLEVKSVAPYQQLKIAAQFRSPEYKTFLVPAFWDGGNRMVLRIGPTTAGEWTYKITGNAPEFDEKLDKITVTAAPDATTWIQRANAHHWQHTEALKPHLYMGADLSGAAQIDSLATAKFTHASVLVMPPAAMPDLAHFAKLDSQILALNEKGLVADLILAPSAAELMKRFPIYGDRARYLEYVIGRYSAFNVTWQLAGEFESGDNLRAMLREVGLLLKKTDPYNHPRSSRARVTSSPLGGDQWMDHVIYGTEAPDAVPMIEHQLNTVPQVVLLDGALPADAFRKRLWNATMSGAYPVIAGSAAAENLKTMTAWFDILSRTRHWDIEPHFDLDGGRALAAPGTEYLVYIENPMKVEVTVEKHSYDVWWINPSTGEATKEKKDWKGDVYEGTPPDATRDWLLHLSRDGRKEGMAKSYKFESWPIAVQEPERSPQRATFELVKPSADTVITVGQPTPFQIKVKKQTAGTRRMTYMIVGDIVRDGQGNRILATGADGNLTVPANILAQSDGVINVRVAALNAPGKVYLIDYIFSVKK
ncbi:MAG TPA: DUF5060 domain-containing protein [Paludibaculum sp.]|jgi:hypothetical protein